MEQTKSNPIPKSKSWKDKIAKEQKQKFVPPTPPPESQPKQLIPPTPPPQSQPKQLETDTVIVDNDDVHAFDVQPATPSVEPESVVVVNNDKPLTHEEKWDITNDELVEDVDIVPTAMFVSDAPNQGSIKTISVIPNSASKTKMINPQHAAEYRLGFLTNDFAHGSGVYKMYNYDTNQYDHVYVDVRTPEQQKVFHDSIVKKIDETEMQDGDLFFDFKPKPKKNLIVDTALSLAKMMKILK